MTNSNHPNVTISIVLESGTCTLTGRHQLERCVQIANERGCEAHVPFEIVLVSESNPDKLPNNLGATVLITGVQGYYRQKSVGASYARGEFVAFWDSDCAPAPGYLRLAVERLRADPRISGVAGVTTYDGDSWLSTVNTYLSFGYLSDSESYPARLPALAHNLVVRRDRLPAVAFGPFTARYGGDRFLTNAVSGGAGLLPVDPRLLVKHEDISFSLRLTLERHLREHFGTTDAEGMGVKALGHHALRSAFQSPARRLRRLRRANAVSHANASSVLTYLSDIAVHVVIQCYRILDLCAVLVLIVVRPWLCRWLLYQYGCRFDD